MSSQEVVMEWESVGAGVDRMRVPGGWLVRGGGAATTESLVFVPDAAGEWKHDPPPQSVSDGWGARCRSLASNAIDGDAFRELGVRRVDATGCVLQGGAVTVYANGAVRVGSVYARRAYDREWPVDVPPEIVSAAEEVLRTVEAGYERQAKADDEARLAAMAVAARRLRGGG